LDPSSSSPIRTRLASTSNNLTRTSLSQSLPAPIMSIQSVDFIGLANAPSVNGYYDSRPETNTNSDQSISPTDFADISRIHRQNNDHPQHDYIHNPPQLSTTAISLPVQHSLYPINPLALGQDIKPQTDGWLFDNRPEGFAPNRALVYPSYSSSSAYPPNQHLHHQTTTHARVPHLPWTLAGSLDTTTGIFYRTPEHPRLRTAQACEKCRSRKAKVSYSCCLACNILSRFNINQCSGERPTCNRCLTRGLSCGYAKEGRMRGPNKPKVSDAAARGSPQGRASNVKNCMPDRPDMSQSAIDGVRACSENQTLSLMTGIQLEDSILSLESEEPRHRSTKPRPPPLHLDISPGSNHLDRPSTSQCSSEIGGDHFPPFLKHYPAMKSLFHLVSTESKSSDQVSMLQPNFTVAGM
jgi:hypothetical protein